MNNDVDVSVAMAVYNSEKYIREQIDSILSQLSDRDELVISYNPSSDGTWDIISEYAARDSRVKVVVCEEVGIQSNFNNAIENATGRYIFLSDHDDVWLRGKVDEVKRVFHETNACVVMHGRVVVDENLQPIRIVDFSRRRMVNRFWYNLISNHYCGSCMAFRRELVPVVCPIPPNDVHHDMWIGLLGNMYGSVQVLREPLILYRRHGSNASSDKRRKISVIASERSRLITHLIARSFRLYRKGMKFRSLS